MKDITEGKRIARDLLGFIYIFLGIIFLISLVTFTPADPHINHTITPMPEVKNGVGVIGAYASGFIIDFLGISSYAAALALLVAGLRRATKHLIFPWWRICGLLLLVLCVSIAASAGRIKLGEIEGGGLIGLICYSFFLKYLGVRGSALFWLFLFMVSAQLIMGVSWVIFCHTFAKKFRSLFQNFLRHFSFSFFFLQQKKNLFRILLYFRKKISVIFKGSEEYEEGSLPADKIVQKNSSTLAEERYLSSLAKEAEQHPFNATDAEDNLDKKSDYQVTPTEAIPPTPRTTTPAKVKLPDISILENLKNSTRKIPVETLAEKGKGLVQTLLDFGIQAELAGIVPGPIVTMYEIKPAPGVKVSKIASLSDDLALALKAVAVRIQAPIPGTDAVGIEVPNEYRETVAFKEVLASDIFSSSDSILSMALGKDISGKPVAVDLVRMPHLLVAGATGAGKSVCINAILLSFLYKAKPDELQLLLVDPKRIELAVYADLPHLVHPVVTDMNLAKNALDWAVKEMDRRYETIARLGVRNINGYNEKLELLKTEAPESVHDLERMPYLVIIIDELADLMMTAGKDIETSIVRLAQLARAAGIHLILATQRPSVNIVTGLIKANFPCRISFQVTSSHDSRTILDSVGAEHLLGKGDMLYKPSGGRLQRVHGAFVTDNDVNAVVNFWKAQLPPIYKVDLSVWAEETSEGNSRYEGEGNEVADEPGYVEAVKFVMQQGKASISLIQRKFRIGFNKAARYVEQMERDGIIGPQEGSKPRSVIGGSLDFNDNQ